MTLTDEQIAELRALLAKMTPGKWKANRADHPTEWCIHATGTPWQLAYFADRPAGTFPIADNAAGIVALVNAAEPMLDEIERLRAEVARAATKKGDNQ